MSINIDQARKFFKLLTVIPVMIFFVIVLSFALHVSSVAVELPSIVIYGIPATLVFAVVWVVLSVIEFRKKPQKTTWHPVLVPVIVVVVAAVFLCLLAVGLSGFSGNPGM
jgi:amino acid permease